MKLEEQVASLELSKRLKELGVRQESAFYFETIVNEEGDRSVTNLRFNKFYDDAANKRHVSYISAFTVAELGEMLPREYFNPLGEESGLCRLKVFKNSNSNEWAIAYDAENMRVVCCVDTEANARAKMLIYLIEQGIVKP